MADTILHMRLLTTIENASSSSTHLGFVDSGDHVNFSLTAAAASSLTDDHIWLYQREAGGPTYIATMISSDSSWTDYVHNVRVSGGALASVSVRGSNSWSIDEQWQLIKSETSSSRFLIYHPATDSLLRYRPVEGDVALVPRTSSPDTSSYWQIGTAWSTSPSLGYERPLSGIYEAIPGLDQTQRMVAQSERNEDLLAVGAAYSGTNASAFVIPHLRIMNASYTLVDKTQIGYPTSGTYWSGSQTQRQWAWLWVNDDGELAQSLGGPAGVSGASGGTPVKPTWWTIPDHVSAGQVSMPAGRFLGTQLQMKLEQKTLAPASSGQGIGPRIAAVPLEHPYDDPYDEALAWALVPTNLVDPGMTSPHNLSISIITRGGDEIPLGPSQVLPYEGDDAVAVRLRCISSTDAVVAGVRLQYLESGQWGALLSAHEPDGNLSTLQQPPFSLPDGRSAWAPNAFVGDDRDEEGRCALTYDIPLPYRALARDGATACRIVASIAAFSYASYDGLPGLPYVSRTITTTAIVRPSIRLDVYNPMTSVVRADGLHLGLRFAVGTAWAGGEMSVEIDSITTSDGVEHMAPGGFVGTIYEPLYDEIVIPWTHISEPNRAFMTGDGVLEIRGRMVVDFGTSDIHCVIMSSTELDEYDPTGADGPGWCKTFSTSSPHILTAAYQRAHTERGTRYVPAADDSAGGKIIAHHAGAYYGGEEIVDNQGLLIWSNGDGAEWTLVSSLPTPQPCSALLVYRAGGAYMVPLRGNVSSSFTATRDHATIRHLGARDSRVEGTGGVATDLQFSGTTYAEAADMLGEPPSTVSLRTDIEALFEIDADTPCLLRTAWGTAHWVRVVSVDAPRSTAGAADITLGMIEVV